MDDLEFHGKQLHKEPLQTLVENYDFDDDDDDDDDDELFCSMVDRREAFRLFPAGIINRDPHNC